MEVEVAAVGAAVDVRCTCAVERGGLVVQVCVSEVFVVCGFVLGCQGYGFAGGVDGIEEDRHEEELGVVAGEY